MFKPISVGFYVCNAEERGLLTYSLFSTKCPHPTQGLGQCQAPNKFRE